MIATRLLAVYLGMLSIVALPGCGSSPESRLYRIEPVHPPEYRIADTKITIAVGPIRLPEHLQRKEILSRNEPYRLTVAEFDRWAEPLDESIASALTENLSGLVSIGRVIDYRWAAGRGSEYAVRIHVISFGPDPDGKVRLNAAWMIANDMGVSEGLRKGLYVEPRRGTDVVSTVAAMSRAIGQLSQDIADEINELPPTAGDE